MLLDLFHFPLIHIIARCRYATRVSSPIRGAGVIARMPSTLELYHTSKKDCIHIALLPASFQARNGFVYRQSCPHVADVMKRMSSSAPPKATHVMFFAPGIWLVSAQRETKTIRINMRHNRAETVRYGSFLIGSTVQEKRENFREKRYFVTNRDIAKIMGGAGGTRNTLS